MVRLIVVDQVRQVRAAYLMITGLVAMVWLLQMTGSMDVSLAMALSILCACAAGPMVTFTNLARKEFAVLPVSRQQFWRARWWLGTSVPVVVTATGAAIAVVIAQLLSAPSHVQFDTLLLVELCDTAYLGFVAGLIVLLSRRRSRLSPRVDGAIDILTVVALFVGFFGAEFLIRPYLPVRWADLDGPMGVVIAAGLGLGAASYFYSPGRGSRTLTRAAPGAYARPAPPSPPKASRPINGYVSILRTVLGWCAIASLLLCVVVLTLGKPFFGGGRSQAPFVIIVAIFITRPDWRSRLRALRTLPIGTARLNAMLLGTSAAIWLSVWATFAILHVLVPASVGDILRPEWIAGLIGLSMLGVAFDLQSSWAIKGAMLALTPLLVVLSARFLHPGPTMITPAWALFGVTALSAAALLNHFALTRSSSLYKPEKSALSFARL